MSASRRWLDPIRSKWFFNRPKRESHLSIEQGLSLYLRLDDVYSYLAVQQLDDLENILNDEIKPLKIIISHHSATPPNQMTKQQWQKYSFEDARILALQHSFAYDEVPEMPSQQALDQAYEILQRTPLQGQDFIYLLEDVFHMLWQQQYGKLNMLHQMCKDKQVNKDIELSFTEMPILHAYFEFAGRQYHAVDGLLRLTRRLQQQKLLISPPIFMINHIEWREHLIHDAEDLHQIQALQPELDLYIALEDPFSWLLLAYIKEELADLYNIQINIFPLSYQQKDDFDWDLAVRISKRTQVAFTPFCRPDERASLNMAQAFYRVEPEQRLDCLLEMLKQAWTQGKDFNQLSNLDEILADFNTVAIPDVQDVKAKLQQNDVTCHDFYQPDLPVMVLHIDHQKFVFNSLYRVWLIESIFSRVLEKIAHREFAEHHADNALED